MTDYDISYSGMNGQSAADILREAKKGSAELVILALLEDMPRHGYELAARIEEDTDGALSYNFASLYATLYKLEARRWIQGRWVEKPGQRRRRYYRLTSAGSAVLGRQRDEWKQFVLALGRLAGISFA
jgi:PadR family transcriptional regulator, regulatory protein PadR